MQSNAAEIKKVIELGLQMPRNSEEIQKLWGELLEFYLGVIVQRKGLDEIRPGLERLHNYFHDSFESELFESELRLRRTYRKLRPSFRPVS